MKNPGSRLLRALLLAALLPGPGILRAEDPPIEVNPNRPTFATPALTTQPGLAELEWGLQNSTYKDDSKGFLTPTLLKLGLVKDLELRLGTNGFLRQTDPTGQSVSGWADGTLGVQWCYLHDGILGMDQAIQVLHKFPTASVSKGLGSGQADDMAMLLFSKDIGALHLDVNLLETWLGRSPEDGGGRDQQAAGVVCFSHILGEKWSVTGEVYGISATPQNPRIVSNLWALAYKVSPRLVLDFGADVGLTQGAQRLSVVAGLTVGLFRFPRPWAR